MIIGPDGAEILVGGAISSGAASSVDADEKKSEGSESQKALEVDGMYQRVPFSSSLTSKFVLLK